MALMSEGILVVARLLTGGSFGEMQNFPALRWRVLAQLAGWYRRGDWVDLTVAATNARQQRHSIAGLGSSSSGLRLTRLARSSRRESDRGDWAERSSSTAGPPR